MRKTVRVGTSRPYEISIDRGALADVASYIPDRFRPPRKVCVITDTTVNGQYGGRVAKSLTAGGFDVFKIQFPTGEHSKNITTYANILESLADEGFTRSDLILALGGGTVGDIAGFVAGASTTFTSPRRSWRLSTRPSAAKPASTSWAARTWRG